MIQSRLHNFGILTTHYSRHHDFHQSPMWKSRLAIDREEMMSESSYWFVLLSTRWGKVSMVHAPFLAHRLFPFSQTAGSLSFEAGKILISLSNLFLPKLIGNLPGSTLCHSPSFVRLSTKSGATGRVFSTEISR